MNWTRGRAGAVGRRRCFAAASLIGAIWITGCARQPARLDTARIDAVLRTAVEKNGVPGIVAMVATADGVVYQGAFGRQDAGRGVPMGADAIFRVASMTKPVTSVAVMQLVERGQVKLDEPASTYLPDLARVRVIEALDVKTRKATLRSPKTPVTVRQLLTHTSGFGYEFFNPLLRDYVATGAAPSMLTGALEALKQPLVCDPGTRWEYGISTDWLGRLVEAVSGQSLGDYCRRNIFAPLGMTDSSFDLPTGLESRVVTVHQRQEDGRLVEMPAEPLKPRAFHSGGGGLFSTAPDYLKLARMLLGRGQQGNTRVLGPETVSLMGQNQIGDLVVQPLPSLMPQFARDLAAIPGSLDKFGLGFATNTKAVAGGRAAGSLAWAGIYNTFFWIDPARSTCAVIMMQILPFLDDAPRATLEEFERAVYASLTEAGSR